MKLEPIEHSDAFLYGLPDADTGPEWVHVNVQPDGTRRTFMRAVVDMPHQHRKTFAWFEVIDTD